MKKFMIALFVLCALPGLLYAQGRSFIQNGNILSWSASSGHHGAMKIVAADGQYFEVEQTNDMNRAAGIIKLYGAILNHGHQIVLINVGNWKEVWEGTISGSGIEGRIAAGPASYTFRISDDGPAASTAPFISGKTLKWSSNAMGGQKGILYVASVNGSTFNLEQSNEKNVAAGIIKLHGEIKDGKVFIYNRKWNETWVGHNANGFVSGKINDRYSFQISE